MQVNQTSAQGYKPLAENDSSHNRFDNGGTTENGNAIGRTVTREPVVWTRVADSERGSLSRQVLTRQPKVWTRVADPVPTGSGGWLSQLSKTMQSATERVQVHAQMRHDALNLTGSPALQNGPTWLRGLGKFSAHLRDLVAKLQERAQVSTSSAAAQTPAPASTSNAAVASAAASTAATSGNPSAADAAALANVTAAVQQRFAAQAGDKEAFTALLKQAFGDNFDAAKAETIRQQALAGDFSWAPKVEVVDSKTLTDLSGTQGDGVALGAYVKETDTIYISRELLHSDPAKAQRLLMEEMGHGIDARINTNDAVGDEGEIFAKLMHGDKISAEEMQALKADNDHGVVNINGRQVTVEYGFFKKLGKAISGGAKKLVKSAVNVATGLATFDFKKVQEGLKDGVNAIKDTAKEIHKLAKEQFKKIMQSKWLGIVLQVCRWIPIPVVQMVAKAVELVRAAYMVYQGIKNKSMSMVLGGVASLASGGAKFAGTLGASTATVKMISDVAKAAQRLGQAYNAIANKDLGAAIAVIGSVPGIQGTALATYASYGAQAIGVAKAVRNGDTLAALSQGANLAGSLMPQQPTVNGMDLQSDQAHEARRQQESIAQSDAILSNRLSEASAANQARDEAGHESINGMDLASDQATQGVSDAGPSNSGEITTAESGHGIMDAARSRYGENWPSQALNDVKQAIAIAGQVAATRKALKNGDYAAAVESGASIAGNLLDQNSSMRSYVDNAREAANVVQGVQDIKNGNYGAAAARLGKTQIVQDAQQRLSDMLSTRRNDTNGMDVQSDQAYEARRQQESIAQSDAIQSRRLSESASANQANDRAESEPVNGMDIASDQATAYQNGVTLTGAEEINAVASRQNLLDVARARYAENWSSKVVEDVKQVAALAGQVAATRKAIKSGNYAAAVDSGAAVIGKLLDNDASIKPYVGNAKEAANALQSVRDIQKGNYEAGLARLEQTQIARTAQQKIADMVTTQHLDTNGMDVQSDQAYEARRQRESIAQSDAILSRRLDASAATNQANEGLREQEPIEQSDDILSHRLDAAAGTNDANEASGNSGARPSSITVSKGQTLEGIARDQYGDDWRAGMAQIAQANGIKANQWGSPMLREGGTLELPDISGKSAQERANLARDGQHIISNNSKGLQAKADLEERARAAAAQKAQEATKFSSAGEPRGGPSELRGSGAGQTQEAVKFSLGGQTRDPLDEPRESTPSNPRGLSVNQQLAETALADRLGLRPPTGTGAVGSAEWLKTASPAEQQRHGYQTVKAWDPAADRAAEAARQHARDSLGLTLGLPNASALLAPVVAEVAVAARVALGSARTAVADTVALAKDVSTYGVATGVPLWFGTRGEAVNTLGQKIVGTGFIVGGVSVPDPGITLRVKDGMDSLVQALTAKSRIEKTAAAIDAMNPPAVGGAATSDQTQSAVPQAVPSRSTGEANRADDRAAAPSATHAGEPSASEYLGASLRSGVHNLLGAGAVLIDNLQPFTTSDADLAVLYKNDPAGLQKMREESWATGLSRFARGQAQQAKEAMDSVSPATKAAYGDLKYATTDTDKAAYLSPVKVTGDILNSLPSTAALAVTAYMTRGASLRAEAGATAAGVVSREAVVASRVEAAMGAGARWGAGSEGAVGYAQQKLSTQVEVESKPLTEFAQSSRYQSLLEEGFKPETARVLLASQTGQEAGVTTGIANSAINAVGGRFLGKVLSDGGSVVSRVVKGGATEGGVETLQGGTEKIAQNSALSSNVNPSQELLEGVPESMVQSLVVGFGTGGPISGMAGRSPTKSAVPDQLPPTPAVVDQNSVEPPSASTYFSPGADPIPTGLTPFIGKNEGHAHADTVFPGGSAQAIAGHGGTSRNPDHRMVIPNGTAVLMPKTGIEMQPGVGEYLERGDWDGLVKEARNRADKDDRLWESNISGMATWLPGADIPGLVLRAPNGMNVYENSLTVNSDRDNPTFLSDIIKPNMGVITWASCTKETDVTYSPPRPNGEQGAAPIAETDNGIRTAEQQVLNAGKPDAFRTSSSESAIPTPAGNSSGSTAGVKQRQFSGDRPSVELMPERYGPGGSDVGTPGSAGTTSTKGAPEGLRGSGGRDQSAKHKVDPSQNAGGRSSPGDGGEYSTNGRPSAYESMAGGAGQTKSPLNAGEAAANADRITLSGKATEGLNASPRVTEKAPPIPIAEEKIPAAADVYSHEFVGPVNWKVLYRGDSKQESLWVSDMAKEKGLKASNDAIRENKSYWAETHADGHASSPFIGASERKSVAEHFAKGSDGTQAGFVTELRFPKERLISNLGLDNGMIEFEWLVPTTIEKKAIVRQYQVTPEAPVQPDWQVELNFYEKHGYWRE